ncbi:hypothetical protein [Halococcus thailandensis]|nr:hypothetical protein [Halococcus thailandensis]
MAMPVGVIQLEAIAGASTALIVVGVLQAEDLSEVDREARR